MDLLKLATSLYAMHYLILRWNGHWKLNHE
jgi:hypothetical protein